MIKIFSRRRFGTLMAATVVLSSLTSIGLATLGNSPANASTVCGPGYNATSEGPVRATINGQTMGTIYVTWNPAKQANCAVMYLAQPAKIAMGVLDSKTQDSWVVGNGAYSDPAPILNLPYTSSIPVNKLGDYSKYVGPVYVVSHNCLKFDFDYNGAIKNNVSFPGKWGC